MHSFRFGEYPVIWQHMHNLTTDEWGPASLRTARVHKKHSSLNEIRKKKKKETFSWYVQGALSVEKDTEKQEMASESKTVWWFK